MKKFYLRFLSFLGLFAIITTVLAGSSLWTTIPTTTEPVSNLESILPTVVLDAGHGGEDGGAISSGGIVEKDINLAITLLLKDLLTANGFSVILTRSDDRLLYDTSIDYRGRKKALDLAARREIAQGFENCVFISIHMNAFPMEQYRGLQVWYSKNDPRSFSLAKAVQGTVRRELQPQNDREVKAASSAIYLLHHLQVPAILIECGFLSHPEEAALLATEEYQQELALLLFTALNGEIRKISH